MAASSPTITLITGPNRGIGRGFLQAIVARPNNLVIAAVRDPTSKASQDLLSLPKGDGSQVKLVKLDSAIETDASKAIESLKADGFEFIDRVIANAGIGDVYKPLLETDLKRSITDTLVRGFFEDIRWSGQELDQALFLNAYKDWWNQTPVQGLERVLFGILLLRVCCIGSAFLQSGTWTNEPILAIGVSKVATHCDTLADRIQGLIQGLPGAKSPIYVQIIYLDAFYHSIQGQLEAAWYTLSSAIRIVQYIGVNVNPQGAQHREDLRSEVQSRHFMFLNSEKRFIELQSAGVVYQINPSLEREPGPYDERILQAKLWQLWAAIKEDGGTSAKSKSMPAQVELRYRRLRRSFIDQLPNAFNLDHPDKQWDHQNLTLKYQRAWLHVSILMVQCGILQDSLPLNHAELAGMSQGERSMTHQHVKLLSSSASALREVLSSLHSLSGSTKGTISILRPFFTRSAILAGLSFIITRSMHAGSRNPRSWPDYHSEDTISLEACKSHIQETLTLLMASQGIPSAENEMKSLQAILGRIEDLSAGGIDINVMSNDLNPQQFFEQSLIGGALGSLSQSPATFTGPPSMNGFQGAQNKYMQDVNYLSIFFDATGSSKPVQGAARALNLDHSTQFNMPMFDVGTSDSTPSTSEHYWESSIESIALGTTCEGLLNDNENLFD